jgi:uncharacterized protein involved in exopolysaccharide biosynthesis
MSAALERVALDRRALALGVWAVRRKLVVGFMAGGALAAGASFLVAKEYVASVTFVVQAPNGISLPPSIQGLASQLGVGLGDQSSESPDFYAALATQDAMAWSVLVDTFTVARAAPPKTRTLLAWLEIDTTGISSTELRENGLRDYATRIDTRVNSRTGITEISFEAPDPVLAADIANRIVARMGDYDLTMRRTSASNTRRFLDDRVAETARAVQQANDRLERFLANNRTINSSPSLTLQFQRLQHESARLEGQYDQLVLQRDQSRINEVSSVPALSVVDPASPPYRKSSPKRRLWAALGALLCAGALAIFEVLVQVGEDKGASGSTRWARARAGSVDLLARLGSWI